MRGWSPEQVAAAAGARIAGSARGGPGPERAVIDSRTAGPGDLFVGLPGTQVDGGRFAAMALDGGAWGVLIGAEHAGSVAGAGAGVVLAAADPLAALGLLARSWRRALGATVIGVTGSTGKTSTKDILAAMLAQQRSTVATTANLNTEIGLPLTVLAAPEGTEALVLEMGMRGAGQIAELAAIAEPDVGIITNVGPVHLELLGSVEGVAAAKAELIAGLRSGGTAVIPAGEPLLDAYAEARSDIEVVRVGPGGDLDALPEGLDIGHTSAHMRQNALAALAAARAAGVEPSGRVEVALSALRGQRETLATNVTIIDDCYNANPMSMRAALDDLAATSPGRRVAVLGDMLELGPGADAMHAEVGAHARAAGVELLIGVGPLATGYAPDRAVATAPEAAALARELVQPGDTVLIKASRGIGLEIVGQALRDG